MHTRPKRPRGVGARLSLGRGARWAAHRSLWRDRCVGYNTRTNATVAGGGQMRKDLLVAPLVLGAMLGCGDSSPGYRVDDVDAAGDATDASRDAGREVSTQPCGNWSDWS